MLLSKTMSSSKVNVVFVLLNLHNIIFSLAPILFFIQNPMYHLLENLSLSFIALMIFSILEYKRQRFDCMKRMMKSKEWKTHRQRLENNSNKLN